MSSTLREAPVISNTKHIIADLNRFPRRKPFSSKVDKMQINQSETICRAQWRKPRVPSCLFLELILIN
ncbi:hypothetical protein T4B_13771 [Trichinella pseudospiralis]|uniref:Uncharacterized protein n=1 Tax=Trichinella pseudospiralis TaxID=6337 RepID=A0A0V1GN27_TRIPS|nr:hypothetical protein T4B_13771 [Trichinella pseudospiralis]KRZ36494.1 hypothetical protein T4C_8174 [Trichinella pseudospiralis]